MAIRRRSRVTNSSTTSRLLPVNFAGSGGGAAPAFRSTSEAELFAVANAFFSAVDGEIVARASRSKSGVVAAVPL